MDLPTKVKGLKLLDDANLSAQDMRLVLTGVDFDKEDQVYRAARAGLQKFIKDSGHQGETPVLNGTDNTHGGGSRGERLVKTRWASHDQTKDRKTCHEPQEINHKG